MSIAAVLFVVGAIVVVAGGAYVLTRGSGAKPHLEATVTPDIPTTVPKYHPRTAAEIRLDAAYAAAFERECQRIWNLSPSQELVDPSALDRPFGVSACTRKLHPGARQASTAAGAAVEGRTVAITVAGTFSESGLLCWTHPQSLVLERCWDRRRPSTTVAPPSGSRSTAP